MPETSRGADDAEKKGKGNYPKTTTPSECGATEFILMSRERQCKPQMFFSRRCLRRVGVIAVAKFSVRALRVPRDFARELLLCPAFP